MLPSYLEKLSIIELKERAVKLHELLADCRICPNECQIDRTGGQTGLCNSNDKTVISSIGPHFGEESPLVGYMGSGTIFLANCNLSCEFCQNYDISQYGIGKEIKKDELADAMLYLQNLGCHNINFVTPTHFIPQIIDSLILSVEKGLEIPIVYNCGGYESVDTLNLLEDIVDIYMPDIKYSSSSNACTYSGIENYWETVKSAVKEMHRQVGDLRLNRRGIAQRGLLVRHLILPKNIAGSKKVIDFIVEEISSETYLNIMDQYRPVFHADKYPELNRPISKNEFQEIIDYASAKGIGILKY